MDPYNFEPPPLDEGDVTEDGGAAVWGIGAEVLSRPHLKTPFLALLACLGTFRA